MLHSFSITLALLLLGLGLAAQHPHFEHYSTQDGLPSNQVYDIFQDQRGYIWLGSDYGVSRFDGLHFENFGPTEGLPDNEIFRGIEDSQGRIWWTTLNGKTGYWENNRFYSAAQLPHLKKFKATGMIGTYLEDGPRTWICSNEGEIKVWDNTQQEVQHFQCDIKYIPDLYDLWPSSNGQLGAVSGNSIYHFDPGGQFINKPIGWGSHSYLVKTFHAGDSLWITASDRLILYRKQSRTIAQVYHFDFIQSEIIRVYVHPRLGLWLGTRQGVFHLPHGKDIERAENFRHYLPQHSVTGIWIDREENWWFSTLDAGIFVVRYPELLEYPSMQTLPSSKVICLEQDDQQNLWIGLTHNYYARLTKDSLAISRITGRQETGREIKKFVQLKSKEGPQGMLVVGKDLSHIFYEDGSTDLVYSASNELELDDWGNYWLGLRRLRYMPSDTLHALFFAPGDPLFEAKKKEQDKQIRNAPLAHCINPRRVNSLANSPGRMWMGTNEGLYYYDYRMNSPGPVASFLPIRSNVNNLVYDTIRQRLWVGTDAHGVYLIQAGQLVGQWDHRQGLGSTSCTDLCLDEEGNLWIASLRGINIIEMGQDGSKAYCFSEVYGLPLEKINAIEVIGSRIYLGTDFGLSVIDRDKLQPPQIPPQVHLLAFEVGQKELLYASQRSFKHHDNSVRFAFNGFHHNLPEHLHFQYRLLGQEEHWVNTSAREILFQSLRPGAYTFEVRAINGQGLISEEVAQLSFSIEKAWWQENGFRLLIASLLLLLLIQIWRWRIKRLHHKYKLKNNLIRTQKEKLELAKHFTDLKISALQLQMNPHFIFNALNTIKGYYGAQRLEEGGAFINKFAQLLRLILEYSNQYIPLKEELQLLGLYLELSKTRYPNTFDFKIHLAPTIDSQNISLPSMLLQPFVENAIIHGIVPKRRAGQVDLYFELMGEILYCRIVDNGIGRAAAQAKKTTARHRSLATQITRERLAILAPQEKEALQIKDLYNPSTGEHGTEVCLLIPIKNNW